MIAGSGSGASSGSVSTGVLASNRIRAHMGLMAEAIFDHDPFDVDRLAIDFSTLLPGGSSNALRSGMLLMKRMGSIAICIANLNGRSSGALRYWPGRSLTLMSPLRRVRRLVLLASTSTASMSMNDARSQSKWFG